MPYIIKREPGSFTALDYYPGWLGAVINRDAYVSIGGIPNIDTGIGDCIMVGKFMKKYGIHELILNMHLYYYRRSEYQASAGGAELWTMAYGNEMQYHKYIAKQYHPLNKDRWYRLALYKLLRNSIECEHKYNMRVNIEKVLKKSNMPLSSLLINDNYRKDISCRLNYEIMKDMLFHPIKYKGAL